MTWHNTHHTTLSLYITPYPSDSDTQLLPFIPGTHSHFILLFPFPFFFFFFYFLLLCVSSSFFFFVTNYIIWIICIFIFQSLIIINWTLWCRGIDFSWIMVFQGKGWVEEHWIENVFVFMKWWYGIGVCVAMPTNNAFSFLLERN